MPTKDCLEDVANEQRYVLSQHRADCSPAKPANGLVPRYYKGCDCPDSSTCDIVYIDRVTGQEVMRYDGAEAANTNPYYGASSDKECFANQGLNLKALIDPSEATVTIAECAARMAVYNDDGGYDYD